MVFSYTANLTDRHGYVGLDKRDALLRLPGPAGLNEKAANVPTDYDSAKRALDSLIEWADANYVGRKRNEATTRLHIIDDMLTGVLGWSKQAIRCEEPAGSGRIDYACGEPGTLFVLEAKREGITFSLPVGTRAGVHSIASLTSGDSGKELRDALTQVVGYASVNGVGPAGVSNGHQWVFILGSRTDGTAPLKGRALVLPSLEEIRDDFQLLWDNVSRLGIEERRLYQSLQIGPVSAPRPLSATLSNYPGTKRRNSLQVGLEILSELFLEDVNRLEELRADFLRDCYASSGALSQYAEVSRQILQTRYALLHAEGDVDPEPVESRKGLTPNLTQDMLAAAASRRPIVLLGDVGVGKTTFIQRLVHVDAADVFENALTLYIDFGSTTTLTEIQRFVVDEGIRQLRERHGFDIDDSDLVMAIYRNELKRFDNSWLGKLKDVDPPSYQRERIQHLRSLIEDRPNHLRACLEHLRVVRRRQIVVFLDNIDQRSSADQEQVFLISNELAQNWPATVFVTLRPETFYQSSRTGALSGYQPRVFTISPPRADVMLQKRVDFALTQIQETGRLGSFPAGVTVDSDSLTAFLEMLSENFRVNAPLLALIDNLAGGNMRMALTFVSDFIGSGHVNTRKILDIYEVSGRYTIAVHEFLRALLFGDGEYYDPEASPIANLLRLTRPDGREHFLLPLLLSNIQVQGEKLGNEGFVQAEEVYAFAQKLGFESDQISAALDYAKVKRLVEASPRYRSEAVYLNYRITTVGAYTVRVLMGYFSYLDAVCVDTPIVDPTYSGLVQDAHSLSDRVARTEHFRVYLDKQWNKIAGTGLPWEWPTVSQKVADEVRKIGRQAVASSWSRGPSGR